jgi:N-formylmaleamate deformylase
MLPHWTQKDCRCNGVMLHYFRTGNGDKRSMVLVHGFSDNGLCWAPVARDLEFKYDVIMPDMRGHGLSQRVKPGDKVDMAADLADLIRALGLRRPIIAGHSMGAMVAYQIGVRFPELAGGLILEDPPWKLSTEGLPPAKPAEEPIVRWSKDLSNHPLEELLAQYRTGHPDWPEELVRSMCESKKQLDPGIVDVLAEKMRSPEVDWQATIGNITHPLLIFTANPALGGIVTAEVVARIRELNPAVKIVIIPDAGHLIRFDAYTAFMDACRAFLREVPP